MALPDAVLRGGPAGEAEAARPGGPRELLEAHKAALMEIAGVEDEGEWEDCAATVLADYAEMEAALADPDAAPPEEQAADLRALLDDLPAGSPLATHAERAVEALLANPSWGLAAKRAQVARLVAEAGSLGA